MEVILKQDIKALGREGEIVKVAPGYARNFLIPRGLAVEVNKATMGNLAERQKAASLRATREQEKAAALAGKLEGLALTVRVKAGPSGRLFGSVTTKDIADALGGQGLEVDRRRIELPEPIKELGEYRLEIKLHPGVTATIIARIVPEE
ncbi:MAG: 50S ribosomal protein L9 [Firmicutes bacterium]|nr:50S ribosomal protein L9 [Bacillota bacterium]